MAFIFAKKIKYNLLFCFFVMAIIAISALNYFLFFANAQTNSVDAIAIRVFPNPEHYSAYNWYMKQGFSGSPQSLTVDGYEAVRDGRTVYADVANYEGGYLHTNIYLISYNQQAEAATIDIFSQILSHWKFNSNITTFGHCRENSQLSCFNDEECPVGDFCDSFKARIVRDTFRLSGLSEISKALTNYRQGGNYPVLQTGSYLPNKTLSVWPSWQQELGKMLNINLPVDPVNKLGDCPGYDDKSCWDPKTKRFANVWPQLPANSLAYSYYTVDGTSYNLCANLESGVSNSGAVVISAGCLSGCIDMDGDGYGRPASVNCSIPNQLDCDDSNNSIGPPSVTVENCTNAGDEDCDGLENCNDPDCSSTAVCATAVAPGPGPIVISSICGNGTIESGEQCDDGNTIPNDGCYNCLIETMTCYLDNDNDTYGADAPTVTTLTICPTGYVSNHDDCDDTTATGYDIHPGMPDICDGADNDCSLSTADGSGTTSPFNAYQDGVCNGSTKHCVSGGWINYYTDVLFYSITETNCADGRDNDCNGLCDNTGCGALPSDPSCTGTCGNTGENNQTVIGESDCNQCDHADDDDGSELPSLLGLFWGLNANYPASAADRCDPDCGTVTVSVNIDDYENNNETRCDGIDNDCDGNVDESLVGAPNDLNTGICAGNKVCSGGVWVNSYPSNYQLTETACDTIDNDCDGTIDEGCASCVDADSDGYGICPDCNIVNGCAHDGNDCNDNPLTGGQYMYPGNLIITCDGRDNDCSGGPGDTGEGCDDDLDGYCDRAMRVYNYIVPTGFAACNLTPASYDGNFADDCDDSTTGGSVNPGAPEAGHCSDGIDNDCDGLCDTAGCGALPADVVDCPALPSGCTFTFTFPCTF